jgi:4-carboxymuconolactone decarboxylase
MSETPTFGRYAEIPYDQMTPEQQEGCKAIIEARGRLPGPTKIWVHNPKLAKVAGPFGAHFQPGRYSLSEREREIAVCVITSRWHSAYPTAAHERNAKQAGLPAAKVEAMIGGMPVAFDIAGLDNALVVTKWLSLLPRWRDARPAPGQVLRMPTAAG